MACQQPPGEIKLHGKNFVSWKARVEATLRLHQLPSLNSRPPSHSSAAEQTAWASYSKIAVDLICSLVDAKLLAQLATKDTMNHIVLVQALETLTLWFDFMELPPELRNRIYCELIPKGVGIVAKPRQKYITEYPAITRVSRQVRAETLPLLYSRAIFHLDLLVPKTFFYGTKDRELRLDVSAAARRWTERLTTSHLRHMRALRLSFVQRLRGNGYARVVHLAFDPANGIRLKTALTNGRDKLLAAEPTSALQKHVEDAEYLRKILGLQGESLPMVLTYKPGLWLMTNLNDPKTDDQQSTSA